MADHRRALSWAAVVAAGALALGACGGGGKSDEQKAAEALIEQADKDARTTTTAAAPAELTEPDLDLPRETTYAGATWKVTKVSFAPRDSTTAAWNSHPPRWWRSRW